MYQEIVKLYQWCKENFISCTLEPLWDGYQIRFLDGSDVVQHSGSYGAKNGCVEPCGMSKAYTAVDIPTIKEIISKKCERPIKTIYIGGGTPSCLDIGELTKLFDVIKMFNKSEILEFTFECNIENITEEKLRLLYLNGVNRLSVGIQTFNEKYLKVF